MLRLLLKLLLLHASVVSAAAPEKPAAPKNAYDYSEDFTPAPFFPWSNKVEVANEAILAQMRQHMSLEVKDESLPGVLRAQKALQAQVAGAKKYREQRVADAGGVISDALAEHVAFASLVDAMVNESVATRNMYGDTFHVHVVTAALGKSTGEAPHELNAHLHPPGGPPLRSRTARVVSDELRRQEEQLLADMQGEQEVFVSADGAPGRNLDVEVASQKRQGQGQGQGQGHEQGQQEPVVNAGGFGRGPIDTARIHHRLYGLCLVMPTGYWSYEWCSSTSLRQFHAEPTQQGGSAEPPQLRTNINSLGELSGTQVFRMDSQDDKSPVQRVVEHYSDGAVCMRGEEPVPRAATVTIQCCSNSMDEEMKHPPPAGVDSPTWYQIQTLIRSTNSPDNPMILHNPHDNTVQPAAVSPEREAHKAASAHLANFNGAHHPPHNTPHHSGTLLDAAASRKQGPKAAPGERYDHWGHLAAVVETSLCQYQVVACVPLLCPSWAQPASSAPQPTAAPEAKSGSESGPKHTENALETVLAELREQCLVRHEEWWAYEVCFKSGVRQFHMHQDLQKDAAGKVITRHSIQGEFSLGLAPHAAFTNKQTMEAAMTGDPHSHDIEPVAPAGLPSSVLQKAYSPRSLILTFEGGTPCDIENTQRSSVVEVSCGPGGNDVIAEIVEDRTCHYHIKVHSRRLCELEQFKRPVQKTSVLEFVREDQQDTHRFLIQERAGVEIAVSHGKRMREELFRMQQHHHQQQRQQQQQQQLKQQQQQQQEQEQEHQQQPKRQQEKQQHLHVQ